jgi:CheY-like chemotaxis protein
MSQSQAGRQPRAHILVIDDDTEFLDFMTVLLVDEGYSIDTASTIDEWEAKLRGTRPDLLICDLWLANTPHLALLDRLAAIPDTDAIPIVLCTGAVHELDDATARLAGRPLSILTKPFDLDQLFACLDRLLT